MLDGLTTNLARSIKFKIAGARSHVQELALSPAFDQVNTRWRDAMTAADDAEHRFQTVITGVLQRAQRRLGAAAHSLSPAQLRAHVNTGQARLAVLSKARDAGVAARMEVAKQKFGLAVAALDAMSPLKVLERGYAIAQDARGQVVREASDVSIGDALRVRLRRSALDCRVEGAGSE